MTYASNTSVSVERSRAEIERLLQRYGAEQFFSGWDGPAAHIGFVLNRRAIRFEVPLPDRGEFSETPTGRARASSQAYKAWEQACRSRWRALLLVIKAKLEAVECGISTVEEEFMAWTVIPGDGRTMGQRLLPDIQKAIDTGEPPRLLLTGGGA